MSIAGDVSNSEIKNCESTVSIVFGIASNVNIEGCKSVYIVRPVTWMYSEHYDVHIKSCYATARIISGHIYSSVIENCFAYAYVDIHEEETGVGLFESAEQGSVIKNCLVKFKGNFIGVNKCSMFFSVIINVLGYQVSTSSAAIRAVESAINRSSNCSYLY